MDKARYMKPRVVRSLDFNNRTYKTLIEVKDGEKIRIGDKVFKVEFKFDKVRGIYGSAG